MSARVISGAPGSVPIENTAPDAITFKKSAPAKIAASARVREALWSPGNPLLGFRWDLIGRYFREGQIAAAARNGEIGSSG